MIGPDEEEEEDSGDGMQTFVLGSNARQPVVQVRDSSGHLGIANYRDVRQIL